MVFKRNGWYSHFRGLSLFPTFKTVIYFLYLHVSSKNYLTTFADYTLTLFNQPQVPKLNAPQIILKKKKNAPQMLYKMTEFFIFYLLQVFRLFICKWI